MPVSKNFSISTSVIKTSFQGFSIFLILPLMFSLTLLVFPIHKVNAAGTGIYDSPMGANSSGASAQTGVIPRNAPGTPFRKKSSGTTAKSWTKNGVTSGPANVPINGFRFKLAYPVAQTITEDKAFNSKLSGISSKPSVGFDYLYLGKPYEFGFATGLNWTPEREYFNNSLQSELGNGPDVQDFNGDLSVIFTLENHYYLGAGGNYTYTLFSGTSSNGIADFSSEYAPGFQAFFGYQNRLGLGIELTFERKRLDTTYRDLITSENVALSQKVDSVKIKTSIMF